MRYILIGHDGVTGVLTRSRVLPRRRQSTTSSASAVGRDTTRPCNGMGLYRVSTGQWSDGHTERFDEIGELRFRSDGRDNRTTVRRVGVLEATDKRQTSPVTNDGGKRQ